MDALTDVPHVPGVWVEFSSFFVVPIPIARPLSSVGRILPGMETLSRKIIQIQSQAKIRAINSTIYILHSNSFPPLIPRIFLPNLPPPPLLLYQNPLHLYFLRCQSIFDG